MDAVRKILIYGTGPHARIALDIIERSDESFRVIGLIDENADQEEVYGYPVFHHMDEKPIAGISAGVVAISDNWRRSLVVRDILQKRKDFRFVSVVHPSAQIARNVEIGEGAIIMAGVCINPDAQIGAHSILSTASSIDHDNRLGVFVTISPGVFLAGNVRVGDFTMLGLGTKVSNNIEIGSHSVIGAGSVVVRDIPGGVIAYGSPCRPVRTREKDEPALRSRP